LSPRQRLVLRIVFLIAAALSFVFALFVWLNIDTDLSSDNFTGEALDFARYVWVEINLMLVALLVSALALLIALRENLLSWRARSRSKSGGENDQPG
jgi:glucan phosphoethanolaminetransferase (alkaline phosphatase superfamily)